MRIVLVTGEHYNVNNCVKGELMQIISKHDSLGINFVMLDVNVFAKSEFQSVKRMFNLNHIVEIWE